MAAPLGPLWDWEGRAAPGQWRALQPELGLELAACVHACGLPGGSRRRCLRCIQWIFHPGPCEGCFPANSGGPLQPPSPSVKLVGRPAGILAGPTSLETGVPAGFSDYGVGGGCRLCLGPAGVGLAFVSKSDGCLCSGGLQGGAGEPFLGPWTQV